MALASTIEGYTLTCGRQSGGVSRIGLIKVSDVTSITVTSGVISAITMSASAKFKEYQSVLDQSVYSYNGSEASIKYRMNSNSAESSKAYNELINVAPCGLIAVIQQNNGKTLLLGYTEEFKFSRPLTTVEADASSGTAITDPNYFDVTLKSTQPTAPLFLSESLEIDSLFE